MNTNENSAHSFTERHLGRFLSKIYYALDGCHYWIGQISNSGYGQFQMSYRPMSAHRFSYIHYKGEIPIGMLVCHSCDNPSCVNPDHLWLGSPKDNVSDMINKRRRFLTQGTSNGRAKLTEAEVLYIKSAYIPKIYSCSKLAKLFSVDEATIRNIIKGRNWTHLNHKSI